MAFGDSEGDWRLESGRARDDEVFPRRPRNHSPTLPFSDLYLSLFNPLNDARKKPKGPAVPRKKYGPDGAVRETPQQAKESIIKRFISKWRSHVGNDVYPAFRLIVPEKDRDRAVYGLKESTIGKLLLNILKISKTSHDGEYLTDWKAVRHSSTMAGDFAGRCYEVISKRVLRKEPGGMLISEVNHQLDRLSVVSGEADQQAILTELYNRMNAEEMMWLVRMILRQMHIGVSERTLFGLWHPDADKMFNISSSLKRVCWELSDENFRLEDEQSSIKPMQCFQPQLAQFQMHSLDKLIKKMRPTADDDVFWIEEKLDGERMQLHMVEDPSHPGGKRFSYWSRKAKDYTYMYGDGFESIGALTRHLRDAFHKGVRNIVLDGEMVTWDMERDKIVDFGSLKSAALAEKNNEFARGHRPLFRVFDILYLNDTPLTTYVLSNRRNALTQAVPGVARRLEPQPYARCTSKADIENHLRNVIETSGEGLVIKNPRSMYRLNSRNDDWIKVKPEYMNDLGEEFDVIVVGAYYGSGRRGGALSKFLCGLRATERQVRHGYAPGSVLSFCRVGGGITSHDYAAIKHISEGKWRDWDPKRPPTDHIRLDPPGLPGTQPERPDVWINPRDSFVVSIKASSVIYNVPNYGTSFTLRFARFKSLKQDKSFETAMTVDEFETVRDNLEARRREAKFVVDDSRKKRNRRVKKRELTIAGVEEQTEAQAQFTADSEPVQVFAGLNMYIMSPESAEYTKKPHSKAALETFAKRHGARIFQSATAAGSHTICVADRRVVQVQGLQNKGTTSMVRPSWLFDCVRQAEIDVLLGKTPLLLPYEPRHMYYVAKSDETMIASAADEWGDAYARDLKDTEEVEHLFDSMAVEKGSFDPDSFMQELEEHGIELETERAALFKDCVVCFPGWTPVTVKTEDIDMNDIPDKVPVKMETEDTPMADSPTTATSFPCSTIQSEIASHYIRFGEGRITNALNDLTVTHVIVTGEWDESSLRQLRREVSSNRTKLPRLVKHDWVRACWDEMTLVDEDGYVPK